MSAGGAGGGVVEVRDLLPLARTLAASAESMEALGGKAPGIPDAGISTGQVGETLAAIYQTMSTLVRASADASDRVEENSGCYIKADRDNADRLGKVRGGQ